MRHPFLFTVTALVLAAHLGSLVSSAAEPAAPPSRRLAGTSVLLPKSTVPVLTLPAVDRASLLAADAAAPGKGLAPLRFAVPVPLRITPSSHGRWESFADGSRLWRLRLHSPGATDLNFGFTRYRLPTDATLHVVSESEEYWEGPYTHRDNKGHGELWTPIVPGPAAVLELWLPSVVKAEMELVLTSVGTGYRDLFRRLAISDKQGSCNNDVVCPEGDPWRDQIRSVAVYSIYGSLSCTGSMIADVPSSFRNFFLTAAHCGLSAGNAASMVVYWNYESPTCGALSGGSFADNQAGATWRAGRNDVDFTLVELDAAPAPAFGVFYSGWDRTGDVPAGGSVGIHHPGTDEKAISFNTDPLGTTSLCGGVNTHWWVDNWEDGTTEPGSSGSGLWNPDNQLLIGFLTGGYASCTVIDFDCYGKFSLAWDGPTSSSRLKDWLDPDGRGDLTVGGADPRRTIAYSAHQGSDTCGTDPGQDNGIWEPGETVQLPVDVEATWNVTDVQGTLSALTPGVDVVDAVADWPDLTSGVPATSLAPHFTVALTAPACFEKIDFLLRLTAPGDKTFEVFFSQLVGLPLLGDVPRELTDDDVTAISLEVYDDIVLDDLDVQVDIEHSYVGDLHIALRSPAGTEVVLLDRPGFPASTFGCGGDDMTVTFDDASAVDLESHCLDSVPWYSGSAAPAGSLAAFNGEGSAGTWTLIVTDNVVMDSGSILDFRLLPEPPIADVCNTCVGPEPSIFADGFESGDTGAWSVTAPP